ncbi:MAG: shikimate kinase [Candidatus Melainabacteria bacterium]
MSPSSPDNNTPPSRIFLTGYMGAGKTTIGRVLAQRTGWKLYDTDQLIVRGFGGMPVSKIFSTHGEPVFREAENKVIRELSRRGHVVISTGGGALVREETMSTALATGVVVYLQAPVEVLYERVVFSPKDRPILEQSDTEQVFKTRFAEREHFYHRAHLTVFTPERTPEDVTDEIVRFLENRYHLSFPQPPEPSTAG